MAALACLPVFFDLKGRRAVVVGGSNVARWKAELLQAAGAQIDVIGTAPCRGLTELARLRPSVRLVLRAFQSQDLIGGVLAIADVDSAKEAERFRAAALARGVPANIIDKPACIIDKPACSDFQFGAIVDRSPLVAAISTDGVSPILAQAVRGRIEAILPSALRLWASAAKSWRGPLKALAWPPKVRRRFWELFNAQAFESGSVPPSESLYAKLAAEAETDAPHSAKGSVVLVGAGPGDPELSTLKALRALQSADVVLYDDLLAPAIIDMARREAEKMPVGKRGYRPACQQDHITSMLINLAGDGRRVVRLRGGNQ
jgi:uroporphyrin-III C-methyltransferase/precorrin-2 dehydrogenase/sirohydrochlorin ferrochelatase